MFSVCPKINRSCPFCGKYKENLHCGFMGGSLKASLISNMIECPKKMTKYQKNKYLKSIDG